jgi:hypothetical protein
MKILRCQVSAASETYSAICVQIQHFFGDREKITNILDRIGRSAKNLNYSQQPVSMLLHDSETSRLICPEKVCFVYAGIKGNIYMMREAPEIRRNNVKISSPYLRQKTLLLQG